MRSNIVRWVRIGEGNIEVDVIGTGFSEEKLQQFLAEVVTFASALNGAPPHDAPLRALRQAKLPIAKMRRIGGGKWEHRATYATSECWYFFY